MERLSGRAKLGIYIGLVALACVEKSAAVVNLVAIERDWVFVAHQIKFVGVRLINVTS